MLQIFGLSGYAQVQDEEIIWLVISEFRNSGDGIPGTGIPGTVYSLTEFRGQYIV